MTSIFSSTIIANPEILQFIFQSLPEPTFLINKQGVYIEAWGGTDSERHHNPSYLVGLNQYDVLPAVQAAFGLLTSSNKRSSKAVPKSWNMKLIQPNCPVLTMSLGQAKSSISPH